jgi:hypothetical protein
MARSDRVIDQHVRIDLALSAAQPLLEVFPQTIWLPHEIVELADGRLDKPPVQSFRTNDPTTWCTLGEAVAIAERYPPGAAGIGFAIVATMISHDFDDCIAPDGTVAPEVAAWIDRLDTLTYTTVSGTGMRVVCCNDELDPIAAGKYTGRTAGGYKVETFVGPTNHFNTFTPKTNGKSVAMRAGIVRVLLDKLTHGSGGTRPGNSDSDIGEIGRTSDLGKRARNVGDLLTALKAIPHDATIDRALWVKIGGAVYAGTGASRRGRSAFIAWSKTWHRHDEDPNGHRDAAEKLWDSFERSPPRAVGAGTVFQLAQQHGWTWPKETVAVGGYTFERFVDVQVRPTCDFVENLLEADTVVVIYGPPGAGKTFFVLDLLLHVAWGRTWFGRAVEQGPALLFALEGRRGVERRIAAFRQHYKLTGEDLPFRFTSGRVDLSDNASVDGLIQAIKVQGRELGKRIKVVAIDTLASALGSKGDENSPEVMNPVLANCHRIREQTRGCCLILVHHPGKNSTRGPRGFSGIGGTVSTLIEIDYTPASKSRRVIVRKQRDLDLCGDMFYRLKVVELGIDPHHGRPVTSCVVVSVLGETELARVNVQTQLAHLSPQQRMALDALHEAIQQHGVDIPDGKPASRVTSVHAWRNTFRARFPEGTTEETIKKALQRARQALLTVGLIGLAGRQVWIQEVR